MTGKYFRESRIRRGLSRKEAARLLGVNYWTISKWECDTAWPSAARWEAWQELIVGPPMLAGLELPW